MICSGCGNEVPDTGKFCPKCGRPFDKPGTLTAGRPKAQPAGMQDSDDQEKEGNKAQKRIYLLTGAVIIVLLFVVVLIVLILGSRGENRQVWNEETEQEKDGNTDEGETTEEAEGAEEDSGEALDKEIGLVTVPVDYMSLRSTPGLGDDVIAQLTAGQYLRWYGDVVTEGDREYYKVIVEESDVEGYVAADYCVTVEYRDDPGLLTTVDVTDALYTYDQMKEDIAILCETYAECLSYETVGSSVDGRDIYEVCLGSPEAQHHIFVQAAIHGREYMTAQLVMRMLEYYAANYESGTFHGKSYRELLEKTAIHVIPMSNPDGVTISQLGVEAMYHEEIGQLVYECYLRDRESLVFEEDANGDMNWADYYRQADFDREAEGKTEIISFEEYQTLWKSNANGVDLNSNFDAGWQSIDLKEDPAYGSYKGTYAESEPETQILAAEAVRREYDYFISYHSKGQLIYYDAAGNDAQTSQASAALAAELESIIKYKPLNTQKGYNVNLGGFGDWVQLSLHGASVTIENGKHPCPLQIGEFGAIWNRNRESWAMLCESLYE